MLLPPDMINVLREEGLATFDSYRYDSTEELETDLFVQPNRRVLADAADLCAKLLRICRIRWPADTNKKK